jgi:hypothetical protein
MIPESIMVIALLLRSLFVFRPFLDELLSKVRSDSGFGVFTRCAVAEWRREGQVTYLLELIGGMSRAGCRGESGD